MYLSNWDVGLASSTGNSVFLECEQRDYASDQCFGGALEALWLGKKDTELPAEEANVG